MLNPIMEPKRPSAERKLVAPTAGSSAAVRFPADLPPPYVDERLVEPETREERVSGRRVLAMPANPEHGDQHTELDRIIGNYTPPGYTASTDLLTRVGPGSDFATDTCIRRSGIDPRTQSRYLEEVAFEVVNTQTLPAMVERAEQLTTCGVRRIFGVFVKKGAIGEWSSTEGRFVMLDLDDVIEDRTLVRPLPVRALLDAAEADKAVGYALEAKGNPVIAEVREKGRAEGREEGRAEGRAQGRTEGREEGRTEGREEGRTEGREEGLAEGIETVCTLLGIPFGPRQRQQLEGMDVEARAALLATLKLERRWPRD